MSTKLARNIRGNLAALSHLKNVGSHKTVYVDDNFVKAPKKDTKIPKFNFQKLKFNATSTLTKIPSLDVTERLEKFGKDDVKIERISADVESHKIIDTDLYMSKENAKYSRVSYVPFCVVAALIADCFSECFPFPPV